MRQREASAIRETIWPGRLVTGSPPSTVVDEAHWLEGRMAKVDRGGESRDALVRARQELRDRDSWRDHRPIPFQSDTLP